MFLLVETFNYELRSSALPISTRLIIGAWEVMFAIGVVRKDDCLVVDRVKVCFSEVPIVVFRALHVCLGLLLIPVYDRL